MLTAYSTWELTLPAFLPRSRLYRLEPIGIGTSDVESLTGYLMRLALAHSVELGTLFTQELVPLLNKPYLQTHKSNLISCAILLVKDIHTRNGMGCAALDCVEALESLTDQSHLGYLTMLPFKDFFSVMSLARNKRAWCPDCYAEQSENAELIYDKLLWTLESVTVCASHHKRLETRCPHCGRSSLWLSSKARAGYCFGCQGWLGSLKKKSKSSDKETKESIEDLMSQVEIARLAGELLSLAPSLELSNTLTHRNFVARLSGYIEQLTKGNAAAFTRFIGGDYLKIRQLKSGANLPTLGVFIHLLERLQLSVKEFFDGKPAGVDQPEQRDIYLPAKKAEATRFLEAALTDPACPSLSELAKELGYKREVYLRWLCPELSHKICARHREVRSRKEFRRVRLYDDQSLREALESALQETPAPAVQVIAERLGYKYATTLRIRCPDLYQALLERRANYLREENEKTKKALEAALTEEPPPTFRTVHLRLGVWTEGKLKNQYPELCKAIVNRHKDFQKAKTVDVVHALEEALREEPPPSVRELSRRMNSSISALYRHEPKLCKQIAARRLDYLARRATKRKESLYQEIRRAVARLHLEGIYPSQSLVASLLSVPNFMRHDDARAVYRETKCKLEIST